MNKRLLMVGVGILFLAATLSAQTNPRGRGLDFKRPGEEFGDWFPLGGIEALVADHGKDEGLKVMHVFADGMAQKGKLLVGDVITHVSGKKLKGIHNEMVEQFCRMVEKAEAKKPAKDRQIEFKVRVRRDKKKVDLKIPVHYYGAHSRACPSQCAKCTAILKDSLDYLKDNQKEDGQFKVRPSNHNHNIVRTSIAGLAFAGSGAQEYRKHALLAADFVAKNTMNEDKRGRPLSTKGNWNQSNWSLGYGAIFLAEMVASQDGESLRQALEAMIKQILANQEASGGWAHGPGGPNALNYLELEIMSNFTLGALGMAQRVGLKPNLAAIKRGVDWVKLCTQGGGVAYSPKPGQFGSGDPGRTAGAYWAFRQLNRREKIVGEMASFYKRGIKDLYEGHACATMHMLNGAWASSMLGKKAMSKYWKTHRNFFMASRMQKGQFGYRPNDESRQMGRNTDASWGIEFVTAHYALIMELGQDRFKILDNTRGLQ